MSLRLYTFFQNILILGDFNAASNYITQEELEKTKLWTSNFDNKIPHDAVTKIPTKMTAFDR